ncbi:MULTISPECIES: hypothetical protein [unclassified Chitinophaga]|uniref:hypothetical protein n=1 Tax=unclassified Chitinophaga TaxID=2619133 RepID=UPI00301057BD
MTKFLEEVRQLISVTFPDDWWKEFEFEKDSIQSITDFQIKLAAFKDKLVQAKDGIFESLNASILAGEYVQDDNIENHISDLTELLGTFPQPIPIPDIQEILEKELNKNFVDCVNVGLALYRNFYTLVKIRISFSSKYFLLQFNHELNEKVRNRKNFHDDSLRHINFISANLLIARLDHFLNPTTDDFNTLFGFSQELTQPDKLGGRKHSILLLGKCNYLLSKWILRKRHFHKRPVYIIKNFQEEEFVIATEGSPYNKWVKYIESHYEFNSNEWKSLVEQYFDAIKDKEITTLSISDIHCLIKYYKDVNKNLQLLSTYKEEINNRYKALKRSGLMFDRYASSISLNYAINNEFSLLLEDASLLEGKAEDCYSKILTIQAETGVKNFFPQYKYLQFLVTKLDEKYSQRKAVSNIAQLRELINKCKKVFEKYEENIEWSRKNYNYVYQLPFNECLVDVGTNVPEKIFIASSFILPLIKGNYIKEYDELKKKVLNFETSVELIENVDKELQGIARLKEDYGAINTKIESKFQEKEQSLRDKEIKYIEVIGIFAAIVTFVASTVPGFQFIKTAYQAGLYVLSLSTAFAFFTLLLLVIYKGVENLRRHKLLLIFIAVATLVSWYLLIYRTNDPDEKMHQGTVSKDSLQKQEIVVSSPKTKIDSFKKDSLR